MKRIIIYVFLFIFVLIIFSIVNFVNTYFSERVEHYIENKGITYTQEFISNAVMENVIDEIQISTLYMMNEDDNKQVKSVIINTSQINKILGLVNKTMKNQMDKLREEKLTIPLTSIFGETLFSKIGPNLNLRIIPIGNFKCDVVSEVSEYGINNSLFEIYILIKINIDSIVPLNKINSDTNCKIPIVMQVIQGDVPRYYYNTDKIVPDVYDSNAN